MTGASASEKLVRRNVAPGVMHPAFTAPPRCFPHNLKEAQMRYRQLGRSGLYVSEICLGAMTFGGNSGGIWSMIGDLDQQAVNTVIGKALESGVNFIDTADVYSAGISEKLVGQSLKDLGVKRSDVVIATKAFGEMGPGADDRGGSRGHIMDAVKASLDRLGLDHID